MPAGTNAARKQDATEIVLVPVEIDGWTLFHGDDGYWIRDLDLADRAEMSNPRDIRAHIRKAAKDGAVTIVAAGDDGGREDDAALVRAVEEVVEIGSGASRKTVVFYLNRKGAVKMLLRLRTPKAIELQDVVVDVFFHAMAKTTIMQNAIVPANDERFDSLVTMMSTFLVRLREMDEKLASMSARSGIITGEQADWITGEVRALGEMRVLLGYSMNQRAARMWINNRIAAAARWGGTGAARRLMPSDCYSMTKVCLAQLRSDLEAEARRRAVKVSGKRAAQGDLFNKPN